MAISSRRDRLRHLVKRARGIPIELDLTRYGRLLRRIREAAAPLYVINDDPFESGLANMFRGIARAVRGRDE